ncbi:hypothetical protein [Kitasatospora sp. NPDC096204]|uniref:hypothetical protein n=1 Tax=Kitasatospora sp. NPDC096204 TaxID=3364094 RepID=UPI003815CBF1
MTLLKPAPGRTRSPVPGGRSRSPLPGGRSAGLLPARTASRLGGRVWVDLVVAAAVLVLLYLVLRLGQGGSVRFSSVRDSAVDTDPARLPYDAVRSLLRMFAALAVSVVFTFCYAYAAARSRRLERC